MGIVIEEMDATVVPEPVNPPSNPPPETSKPAAREAEPFAATLRHWKRRELRVRAD